jgi:hypothetical protein
LLETVKFEGTETGADEHPLMQQSAPSVIAGTRVEEGFEVNRSIRMTAEL